MLCPHCGHPESRITETRSTDNYDRRIRLCRGCAKTFQTLERVAVHAGRAVGYIEVDSSAGQLGDPPEDPEPIAAAKRAAADFHPVVVGAELNDVTAIARPLLVEWWNESRRSKHRRQATWTRAAWLMTVKRVAALPDWQQLALAQAGVEHGWQTLKTEYIKDAQPPAEAGMVPKNHAMQEAITRWKLQGA
jgi:hypothetical protein